ncbi:16280_t:CDS:2, partial [Racocetra persica]
VAPGTERPTKNFEFKKELKTGENAKMSKIRGALAGTIQYNSTEENTDKESQKEAP